MQKAWKFILAFYFFVLWQQTAAQSGLGLNVEYVSFRGSKISGVSTGLSFSNYFGDNGKQYYGFSAGYVIQTNQEFTYQLQPLTSAAARDINFSFKHSLGIIGACYGIILNGDYEEGGFTACLGYFFAMGNMRVVSHDGFDQSDYENPFVFGIAKKQIDYMCLQVKMGYLVRIGRGLSLFPNVSAGYGIESVSRTKSDLFPALEVNIRAGMSIEWMPGTAAENEKKQPIKAAQ